MKKNQSKLTPRQQFLQDLKQDLDYKAFVDNTKIRSYKNGESQILGSYRTVIAGNNPFNLTGLMFN